MSPSAKKLPSSSGANAGLASQAGAPRPSPSRGEAKGEVDVRAMDDDALIRLLATASSELFTRRIWRQRRRAPESARSASA